MADSERIELNLDLSKAAESAKQLSAALQTTKVDTTSFGAALQAVDADAIKLSAETTELQRALERLGPSQTQAARATTDFSAALDKLIAQEAQAEAEAKRLADDALANLAAAEARATTETKQLEQATKRLADEMMDDAVRGAVAQTQSQRALNQVLDQSHAGLGAASASVRNVGQSMLQTSYIVQDFTSQLGTRGLGGAIASIQNNIPALLLSLGKSAGIAGGIGVVTVAAGLLYENWTKVTEAFGNDDLAKKAEEMRTLAKATKDAADANMKLAMSVKGKDEADRGGAFRRALGDFGGGEKLINESAGSDPAQRAFIADAIAKALGGSEQDIGYLAAGNKGLAVALKAPEIAADEAENERRVKAREARRREADARGTATDANMAKLADDFRKRQADEQKRGAAADRQQARRQTAGEQRARRAFQAAARRAPREENNREAASLGDEFGQRAQTFEGYDTTAKQQAEAGKAIQNMMAHNVDKDTAMQQAFAEMINNQARLSGVMAANKERWRQLSAQARKVGSQLTRNRP